MRVAFLGYPGVSGASGGFFYNAQLVAALRRLGVTVDNIEIPWRGFGYARGLAANTLGVPPLIGYDIVLEDEILHPSMCLRNRRIRALEGTGPIVSIVHNLTCVQPSTRRPAISRWVERAYLHSVDGIITVCHSTRDDIASICRQTVPTIVTRAGRDHVPSSVRPDDVDARATDAGPLRLVFAGVVSPHKGVHRLLDAIAALPVGLVSLDIAGSLSQTADYARDLQSRTATSRLASVVRFHGELAREPLHALLRRSHVFVLPSDREAYSLSALDALGFGLATLLPTPGGSRELIADGVEGFLLEPADTSAWAAAILQLAHDRAQLATHGRAALARFHAHGTWDDAARRVRDFLSERRRPERTRRDAKTTGK